MNAEKDRSSRASLLANAGLLLSAALLLTFLFVKTRSIDSQEHQRYNNDLLRLKELDATLNQDILKLRNGLLNYYDPIVLELNELKNLQNNLKDIPSFIDEKHGEEISRALESYTKTFKQKEHLIERFKSQNAVLRNSVQYLPILVAQLNQGPLPRDLKSQINGLLRDLLAYTLSSNEDFLPDIRREIGLLEKSRSAGRNPDVAAVIEHSRRILDNKPDIDFITKELTMLPGSQQAEELCIIYDHHYQTAYSISNLYRLYLYILAVLLLACVLYAIFQLQKTSRELDRSLSLQRATLESTADGILVVDGDGKIISFNQRFVELWKVSEDVLQARDDGKALSFALNQLKDPEGFLAKVKELYSRTDSESDDILELKDGRVFERYSKPQKVAGKSVGRVWSFRDVTEHRLAVEALRESERRLRSIISNAPIVLFALDEQGRFTLSEGKGLEPLGLKPGEVVGRSALEMYRDVPQIVQNITRALAGEEFSSVVDVSGLTFETWHSPLRDEKNRITGIIGVSVDITERKKLELRLRQSKEP